MTARSLAGRGLAAAGMVVAITSTIGGIVFQSQVGGGWPNGSTFEFALTFLALIGGLAVMGTVVAWLRPAHPIGWLLIVAGLLASATVFGGAYADFSVTQGVDLPGVALAASVSNWAFLPVLGILVVLVPLLFPTGRFLTRRWAWFALLAVLLGLSSVVSLALTPGPLPNEGSLVNPFGLPALAPLFEALAPVVDLSAPISFGGALLSVVLRYRRGGPIERRQLRLFVYPMAIAVVALLISLPNDSPLADLGWEIGLLALAAVPVAIAVAIVRYQLFDIDRLIRRTVLYAALTGLLVAVYGAAVLLFQALLSGLAGPDAPLDVAGATLLVAALFQPLRRRLQAAVDRRFDRGRYDAERLVAAFGGRLRDRIELDEVRGELLSVATQALHPVHASLWLRRRLEDS